MVRRKVLAECAKSRYVLTQSAFNLISRATFEIPNRQMSNKITKLVVILVPWSTARDG